MNISITNLQRKVPIPVSKIQKAVANAFKKIPSFPRGGLSIAFVGPKRMRRINKEFLGHDYVTDVLTFGDNSGYGMCPQNGPEAEIIICPAVAQGNAKQHKTSTQHELILYVIHGILHLAGYDDRSPKSAAIMRNMETALMKRL